jgi:hypothetical protein
MGDCPIVPSSAVETYLYFSFHTEILPKEKIAYVKYIDIYISLNVK